MEPSPPQSVCGTVIATDAAVTRLTSPRTAGRTALGAEAASYPITSSGTVLETDATVTRPTSPTTASRTALGADAASHPTPSRGTVIATEAARPRRTSPHTASRTALAADTAVHPSTSRGTAPAADTAPDHKRKPRSLSASKEKVLKKKERKLRRTESRIQAHQDSERASDPQPPNLLKSPPRPLRVVGTTSHGRIDTIPLDSYDVESILHEDAGPPPVAQPAIQPMVISPIRHPTTAIVLPRAPTPPIDDFSIAMRTMLPSLTKSETDYLLGSPSDASPSAQSPRPMDMSEDMAASQSPGSATPQRSTLEPRHPSPDAASRFPDETEDPDPLKESDGSHDRFPPKFPPPRPKYKGPASGDRLTRMQ